MSAGVRTVSFTKEHQPLLRAALIALVFHAVTLTALRPNFDFPFERDEGSELSVVLAPLVAPRTEPVSEPEPTPIENKVEQSPVSVEPKPEEKEVKETLDEDPAPQFTTRLLDQFISSETAKQLEHNTESLTAFSDTFAEPTPIKREGITMGTNVYGEVDVRTRIGNRDVCYLQNNQFSADDWGFNMVMFYACGEGSNDKPSFTLE